MTHTAQVLAFLEGIGPEGQCDDCLSASLHIKPRQAVNQICNRLSEAADIERSSRRCARCGKHKLVTSTSSSTVVASWRAPRPPQRATHLSAAARRCPAHRLKEVP